MSTLLTLNGIPPQIIGRLTKTKPRKFDHSPFGDEGYNSFHSMVNRAAECFTLWGLSNPPQSSFYQSSTFIESGETSFEKALNLHSDKVDALEEMREQGKILLRGLCVSNTPTEFIDLTKTPDMQAVLDQHRISKEDRYSSSLMTEARKNDLVVKPDAFDIVIFDGATPHLPRGVEKSRMRVVLNAYFELNLQTGWQDRLHQGPAPTFG